MLDVAEELLRLMGVKHRQWLKSLMKKHSIEIDPILADDGEIIAEPSFWFDHGNTRYACFGVEPKQAVLHRLEDA